MYKWRLCPLLLLFCTHIGSSKRFTRLSSGISHCFLYFKKQNKQSCGNDCCWIQKGRGKAALLPLCHFLEACLHGTAFCIWGDNFPPCRSSWLSSQAMFSSSVWTAVFCGPPLPCTLHPHSSSGFAILFSAASCTKLCCDCAVGLDLAKRTQRSPFSSYQTTL